MALHTGEAEARGGDYFGPALNRTARLLTAAHGGQLLLSQAAAAAIDSASVGSINLRSLGRHQLRDLTEWETIFQLDAPDLPAAFPPPNTLDVAERRGRRRAYSISAVIGLVILALAWTAAHSAAVARRLADDRRKALIETRSERDRAANLLYVSQMNLAYLAYKDGKVARARQLLEQHWPHRGQPDRRDFAWRFLWRLCRSQDRYTFPSSAGPVVARNTSPSADFSPDGKLLAAGSLTGAFQLWDTDRKVLLATVPAHQGTCAVTISPDGKLLASAGQEDGTVKLWDIASPRVALMRQFRAFRRPRTRALFTPDGKTLITGAEDNTIRLWALGKGEEPSSAHRTVPIQAAGPVALSSDGRTLAVCVSGKDAGRVTLWNIASSKVTRLPISLPPLGGLVESLAFSPDGRTLATGGAGTILLWDAPTGRRLRALEGHDAVILSVAFSPEGKTLASCGLDSTIRLWNPASGRALATLHGHSGVVNSVEFSPRGDSLASAGADETTRLWDTRMSRLLRAAREPDGAEILAGAQATKVAFSPDGRLLAGVRPGALTIWSVATKARTSTLLSERPESDAGRILRLGCEFSPDGKLLATGDPDGSVRLWDVVARRVIRILRGHPIAVTQLGFAAGGVLVSANGGGSTGAAASVRLWNLGRPGGHAQLLTGAGDSSLPLAVFALSADGELLVAPTPENRVAIWEIATRRKVATLKEEATVISLAISPDGKLIAGGGRDGSVHVWDRASGMRTRRLVGHVGPVLALTFSPDSKTLASGGMDRTVRLWNPGADQEEVALTGHRGWVWSLAFSPDGNLLATGSRDGTVRLWRAATAEAST